MTVELMLTPAFFAHFSMILMLDSMIGCPPWQMVSVSAACAGVASAPSANSAAAAGRYPRIPRALVIAFLPTDGLGSARAAQAFQDTPGPDSLQYSFPDCIQSGLGLKHRGQHQGTPP